ncbi:MAG: hypothetical protein HON70_02820, partial [Lentisphaerae bacterium]|nr:hypothetical protein [Lentisphaerota bacterium]
MTCSILGDNPFPLGSEDAPLCRIATLFVQTKTLVTLPGLHATQRTALTEDINRQRQDRKRPPLTAEETTALWESAVDLIIEGNDVLIRPDPENMPLAFEADEMLQELLSKQHIRFLYARHPAVMQAIRERGEYWRISPEPQSADDITRTITESRIAINGRPIYYYSAFTGRRYLTFQTFAELEALPPDELRLHLAEIRDYSARRNRSGCREIAFFAANSSFGTSCFAKHDFEDASLPEVQAWHREITERFHQAVPTGFHQDMPKDLDWRNRMFACLKGEQGGTVTDEALQGMTPEFFRQIRWLPGGRIENGELIFDTVFSEWEQDPKSAELRGLCDQRVKGFVCNYIREFGALQYVNIGGVALSMRRRARAGGHRAYIAELLHPGTSTPVVRIIRIQQWGIHQHLDNRKELLHAIMEAEEYTEYTLDRRLGCWELGMPLPGRIDTRRIRETYYGANPEYHGTRIWATCYERDFIDGMATDKIPSDRFQDNAFALSFARLLGQAAAPNMVVGRTAQDGTVIFDSGDEMLILDRKGYPQRLVVADHAGTFSEYELPLQTYADAYAQPVLSRMHLAGDPA